MKSIYYRPFPLVFSLGLFLFLTYQSVGQVPTTKSGSVLELKILRGRTQDVHLNNTRGSLQWQQSEDGINWHSWAGKTEISISVTVNDDLYLRCAIREANCDPVYSDVLKLVPMDPPTVTTFTISFITSTTAIGGGYVTSDGNATVTTRGICWSTSQNPTTAGSKTSDGTGTGAFTSSLTGLMPGTNYYVRAYAINIAGITYGGQISFKTDPGIAMPAVITSAITKITEYFANGGGYVTADGGTPVITQGICWSKSPNPTTADFNSTAGLGTGFFTISLLNLTPETVYYVKAFAVNRAGTGYGSVVGFKTKGGDVETGSFIDFRDYHVYNWIKIGSQVWMADNLAYLPGVGPSTSGSEILPHYYVQGYEGNSVTDARLENNYQTYGVLYNWPAAMNGVAGSNQNPSGVQGICPDDWHLPSNSEVDVLLDYLGNLSGFKMKTIYSWNGDGNGDNSSGFTGLPGGYRDFRGFFWSLGDYGNFWTTSAEDALKAYRYRLNFTNDAVWRDNWMKEGGYSVRCIKN
ncbi:MAG: hypothetical protein NTV01_01935 [Bacteroidia bacterium]|nr:hypothetical protein [Bacteroidia bacterium]